MPSDRGRLPTLEALTLSIRTKAQFAKDSGRPITKTLLSQWANALIATLRVRYTSDAYQGKLGIINSTVAEMSQNGVVRLRTGKALPSLPFRAAAVVARRYVHHAFLWGVSSPDRFRADVLMVTVAYKQKRDDLAKKRATPQLSTIFSERRDYCRSQMICPMRKQ